MSKYLLGAATDIGFERENQEDYVQYREVDNGILAVIADGTGSVKEHIQPAIMATMSIIHEFTDIYEEQPDLFLNNAEFFLKRALINSNNLLGTLKIGKNEEIYSGYAASLTAVFLTEDDKGERKIYAAHSGNTRLYILRGGRLIQLTEDQTKAQNMLLEGTIDEETYYVHPGRLQLTGGIGLYANPDIQSMTGKFRKDDIIVMTTDGIHYAIKQEIMAKLILESEDSINATHNLINTAKNVLKYPDNMSAIVISQSNE